MLTKRESNLCSLPPDDEYHDYDEEDDGDVADKDHDDQDDEYHKDHDE